MSLDPTKVSLMCEINPKIKVIIHNYEHVRRHHKRPFFCCTRETLSERFEYPGIIRYSRR